MYFNIPYISNIYISESVEGEIFQIISTLSFPKLYIVMANLQTELKKFLFKQT